MTPVARLTGERLLAQRLALTEELLRPLDAGATLPESLSAASRDATRPLRPALARLGAALGAGDALSTALDRERPLADDALTALVRAGERSGGLAPALTRARDGLVLRVEASRRVTDALLHPLVSLVAAAVVLVIVACMAPALFMYESHGEAPWRAFVSHLAHHPWLVVPALTGVGTLALAGWALAKPARARDRLRHARVVRRVLREHAMATATRIVADLVRAGVTADDALPLAAQALPEGDERDSLLAWSATAARGDVTAPDAWMLVALTLRGATADMPDRLERIARFHEAELAQALREAETVARLGAIAFAGLAAGSVVILAWTGYYTAVPQTW